MKSEAEILTAAKDALSYPSHEHGMRRLMALQLEVLLDIRQRLMAPTEAEERAEWLAAENRTRYRTYRDAGE